MSSYNIQHVHLLPTKDFVLKPDQEYNKITRLTHAIIFRVPIYTKLSGTIVGMMGFEPTTSWSQTKRTAKLSYIPLIIG